MSRRRDPCCLVCFDKVKRAYHGFQKDHDERSLGVCPVDCVCNELEGLSGRAVGDEESALGLRI